MAAEYLDSEVIYTGRAFSLARDRVRLPDGSETRYDILHHPGAVTLLPVDDQGRIWFVRQFRAAVRGLLLELPAGTLEEGEHPDDCASREVREEIGMAARSLQKIGEAFLAPGYSTEYMHYYLATSLYSAPLSGDADEFLEVERYPIVEVLRMAAEGEIRDAKTLAALLLARPYLEKMFPH